MSYGSKEMVTYSNDGLLTVWRHDSSTPVCQTKLDTLTHTLEMYNKTIVTASSANKVSTHTLHRYEVCVVCNSEVSEIEIEILLWRETGDNSQIN